MTNLADRMIGTSFSKKKEHSLILRTVTDFASRFPEAFKVLYKAYDDGHLKLEGSETVIKAKFEQVPEVWNRLFEGANQGKFVTQIKDV